MSVVAKGIDEGKFLGTLEAELEVWISDDGVAVDVEATVVPTMVA